MSDSSSAGRPDPDFLDRLIARHAAPRPDAARVRPRLPGPFERVEAVRARTATPDEDGLLWPATPPTAVPSPDAPRPATTGAARVRTERERTVVHTEQAPAAPDPHPAERPALAPPRPAATPLAPPPRPMPSGTGRRAAGPGRPDRGADRTAVSVPPPSGADTASPVVPAALRPSAADTTAARDAVRQAAARRPGRTVEQVVQVQIGRLEVTAGGAPSGGGRQRTPRTERPGATVSLAEYLARGRE
ncbi:hypothetical protein [Streptomyces lincolnensis]|uniref:hypothetical protein n=1 Tax=Streptomyces lincolnensis TaxID=1915 RepID=UPI0037CE2FDA